MSTYDNQQLRLAKEYYFKLKEYGEEEFEARMCALIHSRGYDDAWKLNKRVTNCDKKPVGYKVTVDKIKSWMAEFSIHKLFELQTYLDNVIIRKHTGILDLVIDLYRQNGGQHPLAPDGHIRAETNTPETNKTAFEKFLKENINNPKYRNKYVGFVNGNIEDYVSSSEGDLIRKIYNKYGNVEMYVGKISEIQDIWVIDMPELR